MATAAVTFSPVNGGTVLASELVTNFTDLVNFLNASVVHVDGSKAMGAALAMATFKITGMGDPTLAQDAATKAYVDAAITAEVISDAVGAMVATNTETFITVTYQDADNTLDFVVPVLDEDNMASDSAVNLATQQSIKAYADTKLADHGAYTAVTYLNSWVDLGAPYAGVAYMKDDDGLVTVRGHCKDGTTAASPIFTLPAGSRPPSTLRFACLSAGGTAHMLVDAVGSVYVDAGTGGSTTWQSLDGIAFHV